MAFGQPFAPFLICDHARARLCHAAIQLRSHRGVGYSSALSRSDSSAVMRSMRVLVILLARQKANERYVPNARFPAHGRKVAFRTSGSCSCRKTGLWLSSDDDREQPRPDPASLQEADPPNRRGVPPKSETVEEVPIFMEWRLLCGDSIDDGRWRRSDLGWSRWQSAVMGS